jgi:hypothetical protein
MRYILRRSFGFTFLNLMAERSDAVGCSCACRVQFMQSLLASRSDYGKTLQKIRRGRGTGRVVMDTRVNFRSPLRRSVALVTAYAVALQVMLSAFAVAAPHVPGVASFEICRSDRADAPSQPLPPEACPACLAAHCGAASGPDRIAIAGSWPAVAPSHAVPQRDAAPAPAARTRPHSPRAPPLG